MVGREVVPDPEALLEVALLLLVGVEVLHAEVGPAAVAGDFSTGTSAFFSRGRAKNRAASAKVRSIRSWPTPWPAR